MKKILFLFTTAVILVSCNKQSYVVEYVVDCNTCEISYWDENSIYFARIPASGTWTYSYEGTEDNKVSVAAQSQFCLDSVACADTLQLLADSVYVSIKVDGNTVESASAGNTSFAAAWVEIFLD